MAVFSELSYAAEREASAVIAAVAGRGPRPEVEVMPGFEAMVAGAAVALEKGAPHLVADNSRLSTERLLNEATPEGRMMHRAVARAIDIHRDGPDRLDDAGGVMTHVAADVHVQGRASRMELAVSHSHATFQEGLTATEAGVVRYARESMAVRHDVTAQAEGRYERLVEQSQREMRRDLIAGEVLPLESRQSIARSREVVERSVEHASRTSDMIDRLGDLHDFGKPVFATPRAEHVERAQALASGRTQPVGEVDRAIVAHSTASRAQSFDDLGSGMATSANDRGEVDRMDAYSRALADFAGRNPTAAQAALRIEGDLHEVLEARRDMKGPDATEVVANVAHRQRYAELPVETQAELYSRLETGERVPAMAVVRLGQAVQDVERGQAVERERDVEHDRDRAAFLGGQVGRQNGMA